MAGDAVDAGDSGDICDNSAEEVGLKPKSHYESDDDAIADQCSRLRLLIRIIAAMI